MQRHAVYRQGAYHGLRGSLHLRHWVARVTVCVLLRPRFRACVSQNLLQLKFRAWTFHWNLGKQDFITQRVEIQGVHKNCHTKLTKLFHLNEFPTEEHLYQVKKFNAFYVGHEFSEFMGQEIFNNCPGLLWLQKSQTSLFFYHHYDVDDRGALAGVDKLP